MKFKLLLISLILSGSTLNAVTIKNEVKRESTVTISDELDQINYNSGLLDPGQSKSVNLYGALEDIQESLKAHETDTITVEGIGMNAPCPPLVVKKNSDLKKLDSATFTFKVSPHDQYQYSCEREH